MKKILLLLGFVLPLFVSCRKTVTVSGTQAVNSAPALQNLTQAQQTAVRQELESIERFVERSGWEMRSTGTGLRYEIYKPAPASAPKVEYGNAVKISYTLQLLNGTLAEEYPTDRPRTLILGRSEITAGLTEALLLLHKGDRVHLIIPSHLAYGFSGNGDNIPPMATLLYDLQVEEILVQPN